MSLGLYRRNQILFSEGGAAQHIFAVRSGVIKVLKSLENGKDRIVRVLFPGDFFGFESLAQDRYPLTAVVLQDCNLCSAPRDEFCRFLRNNAESALGMIRFLVGEVVRTRNDVADLSFKSARKRVATLLLQLLSDSAAVAERPAAFELPLSRLELGEVLELSPETISRTLHAFENEHLIELHRREVSVRDLARLREASRL